MSIDKNLLKGKRIRLELLFSIYWMVVLDKIELPISIRSA
jgi:hypothetical protein